MRPSLKKSLKSSMNLFDVDTVNEVINTLSDLKLGL